MKGIFLVFENGGRWETVKKTSQSGIVKAKMIGLGGDNNRAVI
jgi:hypothetical protein